MVSLLQDQARTLSRYGMKKHLRILPMYSGLPYADQMKVFERAPSSVRKVNVCFCAFNLLKKKKLDNFTITELAFTLFGICSEAEVITTHSLLI